MRYAETKHDFLLCFFFFFLFLSIESQMLFCSIMLWYIWDLACLCVWLHRKTIFMFERKFKVVVIVFFASYICKGKRKERDRNVCNFFSICGYKICSLGGGKIIAFSAAVQNRKCLLLRIKQLQMYVYTLYCTVLLLFGFGREVSALLLYIFLERK